MKIFTKIIFTVLLAIISVYVYGQQQPQFSQYMFNGLAINPAYAGSHEAISITALSRIQWVGFEGAPNTQVLSIHSPINGKNIGLGLQFSHDEIGFTNDNNLQASYAYRIKMRKGNTLAFGLQAGFSSYSIDFSKARTITNDPSQGGDVSSFLPNIGAGIFYSTPNAYLGLSSPTMLNSAVSRDGNTLFSKENHYFLIGGYVFTVNESLKIKPNFLVKAVSGSPVGFNLNLNALIKEFVWLGLSYRPPESLNFLLQFNISKQLRIGYSMDYVLDETLSQGTTTSHEFMVNYRFRINDKHVITPRYF
ncbi:type IX secretion system membrane protein PorP/SprF [Reichenbachiella sp. MALMAid0571]|uniref:PorP/SprF family type IX secretion system membrane protein n=1 Tax=Reichenbachiella sp. MALMAid0571 TaxID=3143939 RepID=UPI0032DF2A2A